MPTVKSQHVRDAALDAVRAICGELRDLLESKRLRIAGEIGKYPTPIPACDADFNHMLAERARLEADLAHLDALRPRSVPHEELIGLIAEFAALSPDLDAATKRGIKSSLKETVNRGQQSAT